MEDKCIEQREFRLLIKCITQNRMTMTVEFPVPGPRTVRPDHNKGAVVFVQQMNKQDFTLSRVCDRV